ncbi:unnamed protein product, partial [Urochloa humidicola]
GDGRPCVAAGCLDRPGFNEGGFREDSESIQACERSSGICRIDSSRACHFPTEPYSERHLDAMEGGV